MRRVRLFLPLGLFVLLSGCGGSSKSPATDDSATGSRGKSPNATAVPLTVVDPATAGSIAGLITFEGTPPAEKLIDMKGDPACGRAHRDRMYTETAVVHGGKVQWAFVRISAGLEGKTFGVPAEPVVMDQSGCLYSPHLVGAVIGQVFRVLNSDETLHNVHAVCSANKAFNMAMPLKGMKQEKKFSAEEMVHLKCDVHPWMSAWVGVCENPYYAVSGADGGYTIRNVPPGSYTLEAWHETFGRQTMPITVDPSGAATADFTFKAAS
ncbi:MAG: carboxypeptidase regulatory-like domain-containing protein [Candidatus Eisenbacteria bacterium]|nr:carboxypeptidase regulatory-like domain-containing protein [Candidatus Eisenbacteria bacterium]